MKLLITIADGQIIFSETRKSGVINDINQTNVFNNNYTIFDDNYVEDNLELVVSFVKVITSKKKINTAVIASTSIEVLALKIINKIKFIQILYFKQNKIISFNAYELIVQNNNLKYLNCYNMQKFMFEELDRKKDFTIDLRNEILWFSNFMENNKLNTFSNIYYKRKIKIDDEIDDNDLIDMDTFFKINNNLRQIDINYFSITNINKICKLLEQNHETNITINIYESKDNVGSINNEINKLRKLQNKLSKKQNIKFEIIYSKEYKEKNFLKQMNISFLKVLAIFIIIISTTGYVAAKYMTDKNNKETQKITEEITKLDEEPVVQEETTEQNEEELNEPKALTQNFDELKAINPETVGWIKVSNTSIDFPVVQHSDNNYYLNRDFYGNNNINGWIYMDYRNNINNLSDNTILYGHTNYTNYNLMFGSLINTLNESWYTNDANTYITFNTLNANHKFKIFSIYTIPVTSDYLVSDFKSEINHENFINTLLNRSIYNFNTPVSVNDKILTLSTCYNKGEYRLVVHAKLIS